MSLQYQLHDWNALVIIFSVYYCTHAAGAKKKLDEMRNGLSDSMLIRQKICSNFDQLLQLVYGGN